MSKIQELMNDAAETAVAKTADAVIVADVGNDVEQLWDAFRAHFRGTDIRPAIRKAVDPLDMRAVLIAKLETIAARAAQLIPVLNEVQAKAAALIVELQKAPTEAPPS